MNLNGNLVLNTGGNSEIRNAVLERLASAPTFSAGEAGRIYFNTSTGLYYYNDGTAWSPFSTGGDATALQGEVNNIEAALGSGVTITGTIGTFNAAVTTVLGSTPTNWTEVINALATKALGTDTLAELTDVTITTPSTGHVLYYNGSGWVNGGPGATSGVQGYDSGLANLASITGAGFVAVSADGNTFTSRSLTAPAAGLTISNNTGAANPVFALANDLAAVEGLSTTGIAVRTGTDTWATRTISAGASSTIAVTNGNGVAANPTLDLATLTIPTTGGTFNKFTHDTYGRVTSVQAVASGDITSLISGTYLPLSGGTMTGAIAMGNAKITSLGTPTLAGDAATKAYVDSVAQGLTVKPAVLAATTTTLASSTSRPIVYANGTAGVGATLTIGTNGAGTGLASLIIDGVTLTATGQGVLIKNEATSANNGRYVVTTVGNANLAWVLTRCGLCDDAGEIPSMFVFVQGGTVNQATGWAALVGNPATFTVGTDTITFTQFSGSGAFTAGNGLSLSGTQFNVLAGAGLAFLPGSEVGIEIRDYTTSAIAFHNGTSRVATAGAAAGGDTLALFLDGTTLSQSGSGLKVASAGITSTEIAAAALSATGGLTGGAGTPIAISFNATHLAVSTNQLTIADNGVTTIKINNGAVTNAKLANSGITITGNTGTDAVALGESVAFNGSNGIATTVTNNNVAVAFNGALNNLSDVTTGTLTPTAGGSSGSVLTYQGVNGLWGAQKFYHLYEAGSASTSHTITHNIGQRYCSVTVVDTSNQVVIPESITFTSTTALSVTFTVALQCKVVVMGVPVTPSA